MAYMNEKSYKCTFSTLDMDSFRDANGVLHRNAVLQVPHCSFQTRSLKDTELEEIWNIIRTNYITTSEKDVNATVYLPETNSYYTGRFYVPDTDITINHINNGHVFYEPVTFEFIGYGQ